MENDLDLPDLGIQKSPGRWQSLGAVLAVAISVTMAIFVLLGYFAAPDQVEGSEHEQSSYLQQPFAADHLSPDSDGSGAGPEACDVMHRALKDINERMSDGVTEDQARYFRARRNKLFLMMRERCGV